jgi:hypothetical protein
VKEAAAAAAAGVTSVSGQQQQHACQMPPPQVLAGVVDVHLSDLPKEQHGIINFVKVTSSTWWKLSACIAQAST